MILIHVKIVCQHSAKSRGLPTDTTFLHTGNVHRVGLRIDFTHLSIVAVLPDNDRSGLCGQRVTFNQLSPKTS